MHSCLYCVSQVERRVIQAHVRDMLDKGVIQESSSQWLSPVVLAHKRDGTWRSCVDYQKLNNITIKDSYLLPHIDNILDSLHGAHYFSSMDLQ